ncbi:hypothetical protein BIV57_04975 [Mangrovactinospora gilvigrisea]|uniref:Endo-alpha-N-acetylgalactosaminidase n=1 Tax=Mangrovactinospora gilvigrisea TaxID=1428644 RepID=A0A1J7BIV9_9ACTN|nr:endo-alpha-N-acetylgalactosaminidase family protein [Mangrovactinospora gilvigrisea]OIV38607.1 hypothetical protein BIV57_04975 [Mangrovactinospora gilvigrisea]
MLAAGVAAPLAALAAPGRAGAEAPLVLRSAELTVALDPAFPRVLGYTWNATGDTLGGAVDGAGGPRTVTVDGTAATPAVAVTHHDAARADYRLTLPHLTLTLRLALSGAVLRLTTTGLTEAAGHPLTSFAVPGSGLVSVSDAQAGAGLAAVWLDPVYGHQTVHETIAPLAGLAAADWSPASYAMVSTGRLAAAIDSTTVDPARLAQRVAAGPDGARHAELAPGSWLHRGPAGDLVGLPEAAVIVTADRNGDGAADWQDGAVALREIMVDPPAADWSRTRVVQGIAMNFASNADQPFLTTLDEVKRAWLWTDGLPQALLLKGYQSEGHDSAHNDYAGHWNERAGGLADLRTLTRTAARYQASVGVHINAWEEYPEAHSFRWDRSNGPTDPGWAWLDQAWHLDTAKDQSDGAFAERFAALAAALPELGFVYTDTFWAAGYPAWRQAAAIASHHLPLGAEGDPEFERTGVFTYAGQTGNGLPSQIVRFLRNHQRDAWGHHPLLLAVRNTNYQGWQGQHDTRPWVAATFGTNLPTKFLQHHELLRLTADRAEFTGGVVASTESGGYRITRGGRTVMDGEAVFVPWPPTAPNRVYHWNPDGGATTWQLPPEWGSPAGVRAYPLTDTGRGDPVTLPVSGGGVRIDAAAGAPYVLYPKAAPARTPVAYGEGGHLADPGFLARTLADWAPSHPDGLAVADDGNGLPFLRVAAGAGRSVQQRPRGLAPGTYAASARVRITGGSRRAEIRVTGHGGAAAVNWLTDSPVPDRIAASRRSGTGFQPLRVLFTVAPGRQGKVLLTLAADDGPDGATADFADVRLVALPGADPAQGGHVLHEDFEHVDFGWGPFVYTGNGGSDPRTHLSETHRGYTRDTVSGRFSLKTFGDTTGLLYRTLPHTLRLEPGRSYRISFDYQADPGTDYRVRLGYDGPGGTAFEDALPPTASRALDSPPPAGPAPAGWTDSLPPQYSAPHRSYSRTVTIGPASDGTAWLGIVHAKGVAFVLDNLVVDDVSP